MKQICLTLVVFLLALLTACSSYTKVLKGEDYNRKFEVANEYFDNKKYMQSIPLYEQVYQRFPKQSEGEISYFRIGKAYYLSDDYYMGGYFLGQFTVRFPYSTKVEEATFLSAMCSVNQSPQRSLDQTDTEVAINSLQQFIDRFPNSDLIDSSNVIMDKLRFKLESKEFEAVKMYSKTMNYRAAVTSAEIFIGNYPMSTYKEEARYILVNNSYLLTKHSIDTKKLERTEQTLERYRTFVMEFPTSKYVKTLKSVKDEMEKQLAILEKTEQK